MKSYRAPGWYAACAIGGAVLCGCRRMDDAPREWSKDVEE